MSGSGMIAAAREIPARGPAEGGAGDYPWAGPARRFSALAMPNGDARFGVEGEIVRLQTWPESGGTPSVRFFSRGEAEQMIAELKGALRCFDHARAMVDGLAPTASTAPYPFARHRTLAEIDGATPPSRSMCNGV